MRIAKYLAQVGVASRRQAELLIAEGKVKINGTVVTELSTKINPQSDQVEYEDRLLTAPDQVYILLNKPSGYICSVTDTHGRPTVTDLVKGLNGRLYPVGRLDFKTKGLLLLTNDGAFANLMIHPRYKMQKKYRATLLGKITDQALKQLSTGIELEDGLTLPAQVKMVAQDSHYSIVELTIQEGRKRQVRRMCSEVGFPVVELIRIGFGFLTLQDLSSGKYRRLAPEEVQALQAMALNRPD